MHFPTTSLLEAVVFSTAVFGLFRGRPLALELDPPEDGEYPPVNARVVRSLLRLPLSLSPERLQGSTLVGGCFLVLATNSSFRRAGMTTETAGNRSGRVNFAFRRGRRERRVGQCGLRLVDRRSLRSETGEGRSLTLLGESASYILIRNSLADRGFIDLDTL